MLKAFVGGNNTGHPSISPEEAWSRISQENSSSVLIDVRETWEYKWRHVKGTQNIPLSQFKRRLDEVPRDREVLLLCLSGHRSLVAEQMLREQGMTQVVSVKGGVIGWLRKQLPLEASATKLGQAAFSPPHLSSRE
ncbi:MAG TPA: rhodanese-like domain-containing protein [Ktedonobacteraceae bacterium]